MAGSVPINATRGTGFDFSQSVKEAVSAGELTEDQGSSLQRANFLQQSATALAIGGNLLSGFSDAAKIRQNAESTAAFYKARAASARSKAYISIIDKKDKNEKALGSFVVNRASSGVTLSGSALEAYIEGARKSGIDILAVQSEARKTAVLNEFIAENSLRQSDFNQFEKVSNAVGKTGSLLLQQEFAEINLFDKFTR